MSHRYLEYFLWTPMPIVYPGHPEYYCGIALRIYDTHRELSLMLDYYSMTVISHDSVTEISHSNVERIVEQITIVQDELFLTVQQHDLLLGGHRPHFNDLITQYHHAVERLCNQLPALLNLLDNFRLDAVPRN